MLFAPEATPYDATNPRHFGAWVIGFFVTFGATAIVMALFVGALYLLTPWVNRGFLIGASVLAFVLSVGLMVRGPLYTQGLRRRYES